MSRWKDTIPRYKGVETRTLLNFFEKKINVKKYWEVYYEPDFSNQKNILKAFKGTSN